MRKSKSPCRPLAEQDRIVAELDAEAARFEAVRGCSPPSRPKSSASSETSAGLPHAEHIRHIRLRSPALTLAGALD